MCLPASRAQWSPGLAARRSPHLEEACQDHIIDGVRVAQSDMQRLRCCAGVCAASGSARERLRGNPMVLRILPAAAPRLVAHHYLPSILCIRKKCSNGAGISKQQIFVDTCACTSQPVLVHTCTSALMRPSSVAAWMVLKLEPPPDTNTANFFLSELLVATRGGCEARIHFLAAPRVELCGLLGRWFKTRRFCCPRNAMGMLTLVLPHCTTVPAYYQRRVLGGCAVQRTLCLPSCARARRTLPHLGFPFSVLQRPPAPVFSDLRSQPAYERSCV